MNHKLQSRTAFGKRIFAVLFTVFLGMYASSAVALRLHGPYAGFDIQERQMKYKRGFGDNMLRSTAPQGNIYIGIKLKDSLALEAGFEATQTRSRTATLQDGDMAAGVPIVAGVGPVTFTSKSIVRGPHIDLVGFYGFREDPAFKLFASAGVGIFRGSFSRTTVQYGSPPTTVGTTRFLSKNKALLRLRGGIEYMLGEHLGARFTAGWTNTTRVEVTSTENGSTIAFKPKNTAVYGLGLLWKF